MIERKARRAQVLVSAPYLLPVLDSFRPELERAGLDLTVAPVVERLSAAELLGYAGQVDGVACGDDEFDGATLRAFAPRLKVISKWGTGIDSIDSPTARELGIEVFNTPGAFTDAVADSVLGYILAFARGQPWMDRALKDGGWEKVGGRSLAECTLGVVGVGRIGRAVLLRAHSFGMPLYGNDVVPIAPSFLHRCGVRMVSLKELVRRSDFISLNCDLNPTSHHLIDAAILREMKPSAVVINTARGPVVDEPALVAALAGSLIAGAALYVFEAEPLPLDSPLRREARVLLGAHNANSSPAAWARVHRSTLRNLLRGLGLELPASLREPRPPTERAPGFMARATGRRQKR